MLPAISIAGQPPAGQPRSLQTISRRTTQPATRIPASMKRNSPARDWKRSQAQVKVVPLSEEVQPFDKAFEEIRGLGADQALVEGDLPLQDLGGQFHGGGRLEICPSWLRTLLNRP